MHEASIVESLVATVLGETSSRGMGRVLSVDVVVGELRGFMRDSLEFYFGILTKGTPAEGARLNVRYVKPTLLCPACGAEFERERFTFSCPTCGGDARPSGKGEEFYIESVEAEDGDKDKP